MKVTQFPFSKVYADKRVGFLHAKKGGGPVLLEDSSWKTINGVFFNHPNTGIVCIEFRRHTPTV